MEVYSGKTISKGIAVGTIYFYAKEEQKDCNVLTDGRRVFS